MESLIDILVYIKDGNHTGHAMHEAPVFFESFLFPEVVLTAIDETEAISTMEKPAASTFIDF